MICSRCGFEVKKPGWALSFISKNGIDEYAILRFYCRCGHQLRKIELTVSQALGILKGV